MDLTKRQEMIEKRNNVLAVCDDALPAILDSVVCVMWPGIYDTTNGYSFPVHRDRAGGGSFGYRATRIQTKLFVNRFHQNDVHLLHTYSFSTVFYSDFLILSRFEFFYCHPSLSMLFHVL